MNVIKHCVDFFNCCYVDGNGKMLKKRFTSASGVEVKDITTTSSSKLRDLDQLSTWLLKIVCE